MRRSAPLLPVLAAIGFCAGSCVEPGRLEHDWTAFGDAARAEVRTTARRDAPAVIDAIVAQVSEVERWVEPETGLVARLDREAAQGYYRFPDDQRDFYRCVLLALDYARATEGAFDPTVGPLTAIYRREYPAVPPAPELAGALERVGWERVVVAGEARAIHFRTEGMALDLTGLIKGFALDQAARSFSQAGVRAGLLQIGANQYAWGEPPEGEWEVAIPDPRRLDRTLFFLRATNRGIAASGRRELDPGRPAGPPRAPVLIASRGEPAGGSLLAAVAVADSGADADAMSTALFAVGYHGAADLLAKMNRVEAVLLVAGDEPDTSFVVASASLQGKLRLPPEIERASGGRVRYQLPPESIALPF